MTRWRAAAGSRAHTRADASVNAPPKPTMCWCRADALSCTTPRPSTEIGPPAGPGSAETGPLPAGANTSRFFVTSFSPTPAHGSSRVSNNRALVAYTAASRGGGAPRDALYATMLKTVTHAAAAAAQPVAAKGATRPRAARASRGRAARARRARRTTHTPGRRLWRTGSVSTGSLIESAPYLPWVRRLGINGWVARVRRASGLTAAQHG